MTTKTNTGAARGTPTYIDEYVALCTTLPLAPIETKKELKAAGKVIDALAVIGEDRLTRAQADYLSVLTDLFEDAESRLYADELADLQKEVDALTGLDSLKHLVEQHDMSGSDLGRLIGNRSLGNAILRGDRQLSKDHIKVLSGHFGVDAGVFL